MEFGEKLKHLRKSKNITQEELADAIFVTRTAISKWELNKGYPSIDSLKELSKYFDVTIDELISPNEMINAFEKEKKLNKTFVTYYLDVLVLAMLLLPIFRDGSRINVNILKLSDVNKFLLLAYLILILLNIFNGMCGLLIRKINTEVFDKHRMTTGIVLNIIELLLFIITRQVYPSVIVLMILAIKILIIRFK